MLQTMLAIALFFALPASNWVDHYEHGLRLIEQGQGHAALGELQAALAARSSEGLQVSTRPNQYTDYLPHLYLAIASQMSGDVEEARRQLFVGEVIAHAWLPDAAGTSRSVLRFSTSAALVASCVRRVTRSIP